MQLAWIEWNFWWTQMLNEGIIGWIELFMNKNNLGSVFRDLAVVLRSKKKKTSNQIGREKNKV